MRRRLVNRDLPALAAVAGAAALLPPGSGRVLDLAERLRAITVRARRERSLPFYSMREVAEHFQVSVPTVARAYQMLEDEGLLTRIRGSRTVMAGRKRQPLHRVRGVVGVAVALPTFLYGENSRELYIRLEAALRRHRFVADFIFYREADEHQRPFELVERFLEHQLDIVFWVAPERSLVPAMQQLLDGGIQLVTLGDGKARYPRQQYFANIFRGIADAIAAWQQAGIEYVAVLASTQAPLRAESHTCTRILEPLGLRHDLVVLSDSATARQLQRLARRPRVGVILYNYRWYESLCDRFPPLIEKLCRSCRVMFCQGAVPHPYFWDKQVFADAITWPFERMARRIAADIASGKVATTVRLATFESQWLPRVKLGAIRRELQNAGETR